MPIVQLARLQQEAAELSTLFANPEKYQHALENLLESYSLPVHRQGRVRGLRPVLFSYETPPPVLKQLHLEMALQAARLPGAALAVVDALWSRRTMETRLLAIRLLGSISTQNPAEITQRLENWAGENREGILAVELWARGTQYLCAHFPEELVSFSSGLLANKEPRLQILGLGALQTLLKTDHYSNLPTLFKLLNKISENPPKKLRSYLLDLFILLAERSPKEAVYFLQQQLAESPSEGAQWLARQVTKSLSGDERDSLREALKGLHPSTG